MILKLKLAFVLLFMGTCSSNAVNLTCQYITKNPGELQYIADYPYVCNLIDESFALDSEVSAVFGVHIGAKLDIDVTVLSIDGKDFFKIPDLSEKFTEIVYITIRNTPLSYLKNEHLTPYATKLKFLIIRSSRLEIVEQNLFAGMKVLKTLDLQQNQIFYIHPDVFTGISFEYLLLSNNECEVAGNDIGNYVNNMGGGLQQFITKVKNSTCGTLSTEAFASKYLSKRAAFDSEINTLFEIVNIQAEEINCLQKRFDSVNSSLANVTDLYYTVEEANFNLESKISTLNYSNEECKQNYEAANSTISTLESEIESLTTNNDDCQQDFENANLTISLLESDITALNSSNKECKLNYENANTTIVNLESDISKLNSSNEECKSNYTNLNQNFTSLQMYAAQLEAKVEELDVIAENCRDVNGTCRFTNGTDGYTCIARDFTIISPNVTEINWWGTHNPETLNNTNVLAMMIRNMNVHYMPSNIGTTFVNIEVLAVQDCGLEKLSKSDFANMNAIIVLEIILNNISSIDSGVFDSIPSLETLNLSENNIKSLPSKIFTKLSQLISLSLDKNQLTSIKADFISTTNSIKYFSATYNQLTKVESSFVWALKNAKVIDFTGNGCDQKFNATTGSFITYYSKIVSKC